jgi:hypothetical protein
MPKSHFLLMLFLLVSKTTASSFEVDPSQETPINDSYLSPVEKLKEMYFIKMRYFRLDNSQEVQSQIDKFIGVVAREMSPAQIDEAEKDPSKFVYTLFSADDKSVDENHILRNYLKNQFTKPFEVKKDDSSDESSLQKDYSYSILSVFSNQFFFQRSICTMYLTTSPSLRISKQINEYMCILITNFIETNDFKFVNFKVSRNVCAQALAEALKTMEPKLESFFKKYQDDSVLQAVNIAEFANSNFASFVNELNFLTLRITQLMEENYLAYLKKAETIENQIKATDKKTFDSGIHLVFMQVLDDFPDGISPLLLKRKVSRILKHAPDPINIDQVLITAGLIRNDFMNSCEALRPFMMNKYFFDCLEMHYKDREIHNVVEACDKIYTLWINNLQTVPNFCIDVRQNTEFLHLMMIKLNGAIALQLKKSNHEITALKLAPVTKLLVSTYRRKFEILNRFKDQVGLSEKSFLFFYKLRSITDHNVLSIIVKKKYSYYSRLYDEFGYSSEIITNYFTEVLDEVEKTKFESVDQIYAIRYFRNRIECKCLVLMPSKHHKICLYIGKHDAYQKIVDLRYNDIIYVLLINHFKAWLSNYDIQFNNFENLIARFSMFINQKVDEIALLPVQYDQLMANPTYSHKKNSVKRKIIFAMAKFFVDFKGFKMDQALNIILKKLSEFSANLTGFVNLMSEGKTNTVDTVIRGNIHSRYIDSYIAKKREKLKSDFDNLVVMLKDEQDKVFWNEHLSVNSFACQVIIERLAQNLAETYWRPEINFSTSLFKGYLRVLLKLTDNEKTQLRVQIPNMYAHYDNWSSELQRQFATYQQTDIQTILDYCNFNTNTRKKVQSCYQYAPYVNLVYEICSESSYLQDNMNCVTRCPEGFKDTGLFCEKPKVIVRRLYKTADKCGEKCKRFGTFKFWITECPRNYKEVLTFCVPICSYGFEDHGKSCKKIFTGTVKFYF